MTFHYSKPFESLLEGSRRPVLARAKVVIVGSGYGGSVAAFRLADPRFTPDDVYQYGVLVLERGKEYALGEFPNELDDLPAHVNVRTASSLNGNEDALFDIRIGDGVDALVGSGLGGTSLINANVAIKPDIERFASKPWPTAFKKKAVRAELEQAFASVAEWLGVSDRRVEAASPKFSAFRNYARALGVDARAAPIAVTLAPGANRAGVHQPACTKCGNCVTGCNVGAKNTLAMNLIPAARAHGAEFLTGACVYSVQPITQACDGCAHWRVWVKPSSPLTRARVEGELCIEADTVILAAGTFGSTEILQRSQALGYVRCSTQLGRRFSTNGDGLAMSYGEREAVHAIGDADYLNPRSRPGPTITAMAEAPASLRSPAFLLEEGAIPAPLVEIIGEVVTTAAQFGRLGYNRLPAWFQKHPHADPLAMHRGALEHSQIFLIMSDDGALGSIEFRGDLRRARDGGGVIPTWPRGKASSALEAIDARLGKHDREAGLNGGQYVRNPLWRLLPKSAASIIQGSFPGGRLLTVHPLGGCCMGDSVADGVVDHDGRVFDASTGRPYAGLYVLDGSIIPGALGVNPFMTIAALSWRACNAIGAIDKVDVVAEPPAPRIHAPPSPAAPEDGEIIVREQLVGALEATPDVRNAIERAFGKCDRWFEKDGLILRVSTDQTSTNVALSGEGRARVHVELYQNPYTAEETRRWRLYGVRVDDLTDRHLIASGGGSLSLMEAAPPADDAQLKARRELALDAYERRRGPLRWAKLLRLRRWRVLKDRKPSRLPLLSMAHGFLSFAEMHATWRRFDYELTLTSIATNRHIRISGEKLISWAPDAPRLWKALSHVTATFSFDEVDGNARSDMYVDLNYMMKRGLVTAASGCKAPRAIINCIAYTARLARSAMQAGFWEFGAPTYPRRPIERAPHPPASIGGYEIDGVYDLYVEKRLPGGRGQIRLQLHRYGRGAARGPVLLIHGLAQGSLIYAHERLGGGMALHLLRNGYEVWLLDHRLSNRFDARAIPYDGWSMDEIGAYDVPEAVRLVHRMTGRRIHIFAHCVGAVGVTMAVLNGRISEQEVASIALNAIHPWVLASAFNNVRAKLGVAFRDLIGDGELNPLIETQAEITPAQTFLDRLAFSVARLDEEDTDRHARDDDLINAICDRMTFLYGRMWRHANVADVHAYWKDLVGRAPGAVYRHLHYLLTHERVVDREGGDRYITAENLARWRGIRTLFMHGDRSLVFNPQSATRSAIRLTRFMKRLQQEGGPATPVRLRRIPEYGHMDVILAQSAPRESFRYVDHFFRGDFDRTISCTADDGSTITMDEVRPDDDPTARNPSTESVGPIMRAARIRNDHLIVRYWIEFPPDAIEPQPPVRLIRPVPVSHAHVPQAPDMEACYHWIDAHFERGQWDGFKGSWLSRLEQLSRGALEDCHFIVASCWYPGTAFDREQCDQAFAGIATLLDSHEPCDALFLIGDQIYADASGGILDPATWRDRYIERYWSAFRSARAQQVFGSIPTHFTIDDHEIANDYAGVVPTYHGVGLMPGVERTDAIRSGGIDAAQLELARLAARSYIGSGRDRTAFGASTTDPGALWYALDHGVEFPCPAFIMDARSERRRAVRGEPARMMSRRQMEALKDWLRRANAVDRPKFIFAGSALAPQPRDANAPGRWLREDGFAGYPDELDELITFILDHQIQGVVFVSGDLHLSCMATLTLKDGRPRGARRPDVRALQVVASGLYAPFRFVNTNPVDVPLGESAKIALPHCSIEYTTALITAGASHFVKVEAQRAAGGWRITATAFDPEGDPTGETQSWLTAIQPTAAPPRADALPS